MPYIQVNRREALDQAIDQLISALKSFNEQDLRNLDGDLNYSISRLMLGALQLAEKPKYTKYNTALGVLEGVKLELYRRFTAPYEDQKITENGDIV